MRFETDNQPSLDPAEIYASNPGLALSVIVGDLLQKQPLVGEEVAEWHSNTTALLANLATVHHDPNVRAAYIAFGQQIIDAQNVQSSSSDEPHTGTYDPARFTGKYRSAPSGTSSTMASDVAAGIEG